MSSADLDGQYKFQAVENLPFDEVYDLSDAESIESTQSDPPDSPMPREGIHAERGSSPPSFSEDGQSGYEDEDNLNQMNRHQEHGGELSDSMASSEESRVELPSEGNYDPSEYENLQVSAEIKELFGLIGRYTPQTVEMKTRLQPFVPDFIPAVGDIDPFIKPPRPDGVPTSFGLDVVNEPCLAQSDPAVLEMQLRRLAKTAVPGGSGTVKVLENERDVKKRTKAIDDWVKSITEIHRQKPPPTVQFTKKMPDVESLMQEWPPEVESMLKTMTLPTADLNTPLESFVDIACALVDIPVNNNRIHSLYLFFKLFSEFKNSQHFQSDEGPPVEEENVLQMS